MTEQMGNSNAEVLPPDGHWEPQMFHGGKWQGFYDDPNEKTFKTEGAAWDCARRCFPDTEHLSAMVQVVFIAR